jgi:uncharacterized lipoprotein YehR (DUF1307 family)
MRNKFIKSLAVALLIMPIALALVACGSKITSANYDKIEQNVTTYTQAKEILGKPTTDSTLEVLGVKSGIAVWKDGDKVITLTFTNNIVTLKHSLGLG